MDDVARHRAGRRRADLGRDRRAALRPGLPPRLPADRQPARRRGPHPGGLRPGLPLAVDLHARHLRGLAAPDHHQPLPRPGPAQAADPLRRAHRRAGGPADQRAAEPRRGLRRPALRRRRRARARDAAAGLPRRRGAVRRRGAHLRGDRRDPRRQARHRPVADPPRPRAAAQARWRTARPRPGRARYSGPLDRRRSAPLQGARRDRPPRRPRQRAARRPAVPGRGGAGLGARARLPPVPRPRRARGLGQDPAGRAVLRRGAARRPRSRGRCSRRCPVGLPPGRRLPRRSGAATRGRAGSRWSRSAAAPPAPP